GIALPQQRRDHRPGHDHHAHGRVREPHADHGRGLYDLHQLEPHAPVLHRLPGERERLGLLRRDRVGAAARDSRENGGEPAVLASPLRGRPNPTPPPPPGVSSFPTPQGCGGSPAPPPRSRAEPSRAEPSRAEPSSCAESWSTARATCRATRRTRKTRRARSSWTSRPSAPSRPAPRSSSTSPSSPSNAGSTRSTRSSTTPSTSRR